MNTDIGAASDMPGTTWHALSAEDALTRLSSNAPSGLDAVEAARRFQRHGPNRLPRAATRGPLQRFLLQFHNILVYVLMNGTLLSNSVRSAAEAASRSTRSVSPPTSLLFSTYIQSLISPGETVTV